MKIDWKSESAAVLLAFTLTGAAMWGSILPAQPVPYVPAQTHPQASAFTPNLASAADYREGRNA